MALIDQKIFPFEVHQQKDPNEYIQGHAKSQAK